MPVFFVIFCISPLFLIFVFVVYLLLFGLFLIFLLESYYYSYIIYLLFLSGLLVMFMYVCSIICNEKIYLKLNLFGALLLSVIMFFLNSNLFGFHLSLDLSFYYEFYFLIKFFVYSFNFLSGFLIFYLFFCLIVVYEVIKKNAGPLRMSS